MNYYVNIRVLPTPEFSESILMNAVFAHLHKALVTIGRGGIGVSFPNVNKTFGDLLRLHGSQSSLQSLLTILRFGGLIDYIKVSEVIKVPENVGYRIVKRVQSKSSTERLIRRSVRKGWVTEEDAIRRVRDGIEKRLLLPYLEIKSQSTGQMFRLFIEHGPIETVPVTGVFTAYGLSSGATIPWF